MSAVNAVSSLNCPARSKKTKPRQHFFAALRLSNNTGEAIWSAAKPAAGRPDLSITCDKLLSALQSPGVGSCSAPATDPVSPPRASFRQEVSARTIPEPPSAEDIFGWVGGNMAQIKGHARKYLAYSPYEMDEFVQQAYETALLAREEAIRKSAAFEKMFWSSFRIACIRMTYTNGEKLEITHGEYQEFWDDDSSALQPPPELLTDSQEMLDAIDAPMVGPADPLEGLLDELSPARTKALAAKALDLMTPKERRAWQMHIKGYSRREIARLIGTSRQGVQKTLKRGLKHARPLAVSVGLRPPTARKLGRPQAGNQAAAQGYLPLIEEVTFSV